MCGGLRIFRGARRCLRIGQRVVQGSGSWYTGCDPGSLVCGTQAFLSSLRRSSAKGDVVQSLSRVRLFVTPWTAARQASLTFTISQSLLKLMSIESVIPSNRLVLCCPLLLLPSIFPSIRGFSDESALRIRWPKYWSFSFSINPSNEYSGLISFRMDWWDHLAVQGTLSKVTLRKSPLCPSHASAYLSEQKAGAAAEVSPV